MNRLISRYGARLGNWNDRRFGKADRSADNPRLWKLLNAVARWMHIRGDLTRW